MKHVMQVVERAQVCWPALHMHAASCANGMPILGVTGSVISMFQQYHGLYSVSGYIHAPALPPVRVMLTLGRLLVWR